MASAFDFEKQLNFLNFTEGIRTRDFFYTNYHELAINYMINSR